MFRSFLIQPRSSSPQPGPVNTLDLARIRERAACGGVAGLLTGLEALGMWIPQPTAVRGPLGLAADMLDDRQTSTDRPSLGSPL